MIWIIISSILVTVTFILTFLATGNVWDATNVAGIVSLLYMMVFISELTRPPMVKKQRWWVIGICSAVILGTILHWNVTYRQTHYQYDTLHKIRKVIHHGIATAMFVDECRRTFSKYSEQRGPEKKSLGRIFREVTRFDARDSTLIVTGAWERMKTYSASVSDTEIVLVVLDSARLDGEDPHFKNFDGRYGMAQDLLRISETGYHYELQN